MKHTISVLVQNKFGVLARVAGLFSGRGFNIDSLTVGETQDATVSRMTIVVHGDDLVLEQVIKQLNKLIEVIKVIDLKGRDKVERELVLIKVGITSKTRAEIIQIADIFRAKIINCAKESITIEITGDEGKINAFFDLMKSFGILEVARTGKVALLRN
ncbi:MAG: acetolactate synthase small subunit [Chlamydiota bacterium]|nr:acetolactate synthase small subunit [Chlamydiota bacterium]